jgi:hypothetical protein
MPKVEQNGMPTSLHYSAYVQTLNVADLADRMEGDFDVINQRKYTSRHCNQDYAVRIVLRLNWRKRSSKRLTGR